MMSAPQQDPKRNPPEIEPSPNKKGLSGLQIGAGIGAAAGMFAPKIMQAFSRSGPYDAGGDSLLSAFLWGAVWGAAFVIPGCAIGALVDWGRRPKK